MPATTSPPEQSKRRRLHDKVLSLFEKACDAGDLDIAAMLLRTVELSQSRFCAKERRRQSVELVAAHERLWHLRNEGCSGNGAAHLPREAGTYAQRMDPGVHSRPEV